MQVDVTECIEWLNEDDDTKVITLYIEGLKDGRKFIDVCKKSKKPIVVLKAGRTEEGHKAIGSHTGSLAGSFAVYQAAFKQAGVIEVETVEELFDVAQALDQQPPCLKNSIAIISNGGGGAVLCADYCAELGINLAVLKESVLEAMDKSGKMHPAYSRRNPLDIVGDAGPERYRVAFNTLLADSDIAGLIIIETKQTMSNPIRNAHEIVKARKKFPDKPIVYTTLGGFFSQNASLVLKKHGIPNFNDPRKSALAMKALIDVGKRFVAYL